MIIWRHRFIASVPLIFFVLNCGPVKTPEAVVVKRPVGMTSSDIPRSEMLALPTPQAQAQATALGPLRIQMELDTVRLDAPLPAGPLLKEGISFRNDQTLVKWASPAFELVAVVDPLRASVSRLTPLYRSTCVPENRAILGPYAQWCVDSSSQVSLLHYKVETNQGSEMSVQIPEGAQDKSIPRIMGAGENWIVLGNGLGILAFVRLSDRSFETLRLDFPSEIPVADRASLVGGIFRSSDRGRKPLIWIQSQDRVFLHDANVDSASLWREVLFDFSGAGLDVMTRFERLVFVRGVENNSPLWGAAVWDGSDLRVSKGMVTSPAPPPVPTLPPAQSEAEEDDVYWSSKGRALVSQYCTGCHDHSFGENPPDRILFQSAKESILYKTSLQPEQTGVMPPYGAPRVPAAQLTELQDWLRQSP